MSTLAYVTMDTLVRTVISISTSVIQIHVLTVEPAQYEQQFLTQF